jgi:hypothetical protein
MKAQLGKLTMFVILPMTLAVQAVAQATYGFFNYVPSVGLDAPVFDAAGERLSGTNYVAKLYGGPTPDSLQPATVGIFQEMEPVPFTYIANGLNGYFARSGYVEVQGVPSGGFAWLQVRAWDARLGRTYEEVAALGSGEYGESALFYTFGGDSDVATGRPPQPLRGLQSFSLVPEPSAWALLAFGVGFLFWRWRRKE